MIELADAMKGVCSQRGSEIIPHILAVMMMSQASNAVPVYMKRRCLALVPDLFVVYAIGEEMALDHRGCSLSWLQVKRDRRREKGIGESGVSGRGGVVLKSWGSGWGHRVDGGSLNLEIQNRAQMPKRQSGWGSLANLLGLR